MNASRKSLSQMLSACVGSDARRRGVRAVLCLWMVGGVMSGMCAAAETATSATIPDYNSVRKKVLEWSAKRVEGWPEQGAELEKLWPEADPQLSPDELWERTLASFSLADPATAEFLRKLSESGGVPRPIEAGLLFETERGDFYLANVRLHYARRLVQQEIADLGLELIGQINPAEVVSPAAYLFYQACCQRRLLMKAEGLKTVETLLKLPESRPERYVQLARLMKEEWSAVEDRSLEEASMLMEDVRRRLKLAQPGQKTQNAEDQVISRLDEIIKKLEDQQNGGGGSASSGGSNRRPGTPAEDSKIHGFKAPGEVDPKTMKGGDVWGNLDEKQRTEVQNLISRDFPAHYRRTIEEYFRKLATRRDGAD